MFPIVRDKFLSSARYSVVPSLDTRATPVPLRVSTHWERATKWHNENWAFVVAGTAMSMGIASCSETGFQSSIVACFLIFSPIASEWVLSYPQPGSWLEYTKTGRGDMKSMRSGIDINMKWWRRIWKWWSRTWSLLQGRQKPISWRLRWGWSGLEGTVLSEEGAVLSLAHGSTVHCRCFVIVVGCCRRCHEHCLKCGPTRIGLHWRSVDAEESWRPKVQGKTLQASFLHVTNNACMPSRS